MLRRTVDTVPTDGPICGRQSANSAFVRPYGASHLTSQGARLSIDRCRDRDNPASGGTIFSKSLGVIRVRTECSWNQC